MILGSAERACGGLAHEIDTPRTIFTPEDVIARTKLPENLSETPNIIGWSGPARSGTTSLLFLLASHPEVDRAYFQPQKTILRQGEPAFELYAEDSVVCMKEVMRSCCPENDHDPIATLLRAGVPPSKITWITMLRDPVQSYSSWTQRYDNISPEKYAMTQRYALDLFEYYHRSGVRMIPFAYDLLKNNESYMLRRLLDKVGLSSDNFDLEFKPDAISHKLALGQALDREYYNRHIRKTYERHRLTYSANKACLPPDVAQEVRFLCQPSFEDFAEVCASEFGL